MEPEYNTLSKNKKRTRKDKEQVEQSNEIVETKKKKLDEDLPRGGFFRPAPPQSQELTTTSTSQPNLFKFDSKIVAKKDAKKPKKTSKKAAKEAEAMDVELSSEIHMLRIDSITVGVKTLGVISGFDGDKINVDLPNHLKGFIDITEISDELNAKIMREIDILKSTTVNLKDYFSIGDIVRCVVSDLTVKDSDIKKRITLSLRPAVVNQGLDIDNIVSGTIIRGTVKSIEDHGYIINTGISKVEGFLPKNKAPANLKIGLPIDLHVASVNKDAKILTLDATPESWQMAFKNAKATVEALVPGILVEAEIFDVSTKGVFVKFLGDVLGTVHFSELGVEHPFDLEETFKKGSKVNARLIWVNTEVHSFALTFADHFLNWENQEQIPAEVLGSVSRVTVTYVFPRGIMVKLEKEGMEGFVSADHLDIDVANYKTIAESYPVGSQHTGRVMSYDYFNQLPILTLKEKEIASPIFSFSDVSVGDIVEAEPFDIQTDYVRVKLSEFVTGICYSMHWSDSNLKNPSKKFQTGKKSKFRVIKVDPKNRILLLSSKPSIIDCNGVIPHDYKSLKSGDILSGWVVKIGAFGLLLAFFDDLTAVVTKKDLNIDSTADHNKFFQRGQVLQCKVVNVDTERAKMRVTLNLEDVSSKAATEYSAGQILSAKISQIDKTKSMIRIQLPNKEKAMLDFSQLSEFHSDKIPASLTTKSSINVLVLNDKSTQVTAKPFLVENAAKIPRNFSEIKVGESYFGSANNSKIGTFVNFLGNLQGFDPTARDVAATGQTVKFQVSEKDEIKQRVKGTVKCQWDHKLLLEQFYKEEEMLSTVDWKKYQIGGVVDLVVKEIIPEEGVVMETNGVSAFALLQHSQGAKVGDKVKGKILDIDYDKNILDVCLNNVSIKNEKLSVTKNQEATVKLVKKNIVVLSLQNEKSIGFAFSKDINASDAFSMYVVGQKVNVSFKGVYNGIQERNLFQIIREKENNNKKNDNKKKQ